MPGEGGQLRKITIARQQLGKQWHIDKACEVQMANLDVQGVATKGKGAEITVVQSLMGTASVPSGWNPRLHH
jgi:hypothetical protein